jgi:acetylornithine deacetylase/succinyl-diaminopimelate desuccinylase-like protein
MTLPDLDPAAGRRTRIALVHERGSRAGEVIFAAVADEEVASLGTRALLEDLNADYALVLDVDTLDRLSREV